MSDLAQAFDAVDADLRVIATLDVMSYEVEYIRDDVEDAYSQSDLEEAYQNVIANQISSTNLAQTSEFGRIISQQFVFEEAIVFLFPSSRYEGVFVSYDRTDSFPVFDVIDVADELPSLTGDEAE